MYHKPRAHCGENTRTSRRQDETVATRDVGGMGFGPTNGIGAWSIKATLARGEQDTFAKAPHRVRGLSGRQVGPALIEVGECDDEHARR